MNNSFSDIAIPILLILIAIAVPLSVTIIIGLVMHSIHMSKMERRLQVSDNNGKVIQILNPRKASLEEVERFISNIEDPLARLAKEEAEKYIQQEGSRQNEVSRRAIAIKKSIERQKRKNSRKPTGGSE